MALPMIRPTKHPKTGVYRIRSRVPKSLQDIIGSAERVISLATKDPDEAKRRAPAAERKIAEEIATARATLGPARRLTHREIAALCGELYRETTGHWEADPGTAEDWQAYADQLYDELERDVATGEAVGPSRADLADAKRITLARGVPADPTSVHRLASAFYRTKLKAAETLGRRADGDYSPDPHLETFPPVEAEKPQAAAEEPLTSESLLADWGAERTPAASTVRSYQGKFRQLARVLGFDDLRRITPDHVIRFKEARLKEGKDPGTVADDVLGMGAVCKWAVANRKISNNPFVGLAPKVNRRGPAPRHPYDDAEARRILHAARQEDGWLRWLPWLLCFTGARVSELVELRRRDVRERDGVMVLDIVPLVARAGKNGIAQRMIPLHPAMIAEGFLKYVASLPPDDGGPLFPSIAPDPQGSRVHPATVQSGRWVRDVVGIKELNKAPNHSWRHRMEDELRKVRALPEVQDAITGRNNPRNAGAGYGKGFRGMPDEVLKELQRIPSPATSQIPGST